MATPERSCIGCRRRRGQRELVRLKVEGGRVVPARPGSPGRSAYLCPDRRCLEAAVKKRAFARAFRMPVHIDEAALDAALGTQAMKGGEVNGEQAQGLGHREPTQDECR